MFKSSVYSNLKKKKKKIFFFFLTAGIGEDETPGRSFIHRSRCSTFHGVAFFKQARDVFDTLDSDANGTT